MSVLVHTLGAGALATLLFPAPATAPPRAHVDSGSHSIHVTLIAAAPIVVTEPVLETPVSTPIQKTLAPSTIERPLLPPAPVPPTATPAPLSPIQPGKNLPAPISWPTTDLFRPTPVQTPKAPTQTNRGQPPLTKPPTSKSTKLTPPPPRPDIKKLKLKPTAPTKPKVVRPVERQAPRALRATAPSNPEDAGASTTAKVIGDLSPRYPALSRRLGEQGLVVLLVRVLPNGRAGEVRVLRQPGRQRLVDAAIAAVRRATFTPAMRHGKSVAAWLETPVRFVLE